MTNQEKTNEASADDPQINKIRSAFACYVERFRSQDNDMQRNLDLKYAHSLRVMKEAEALAGDLRLDKEQIRWATVMGLLHDVGRFEQYRRHRTFVDDLSEDHAALGVRVLQTEPILNGYPAIWVDRILKAIAYHNRYRLPAEETEEVLLYTRILRDADKLDIFRVVIGYYNRTSGRKNAAIELNLPDVPEASPEVIGDLQNGRSVDKRFVRTLTDFKLLQIGWVYDINFPFTYGRILQRQILQKMAAALPRIPEIAATVNAVESFLAAKASAPNP